MRVLQTATYIEANAKNFNPNPRHSDKIKFVVIHYTSNKGDTARNNAMYFHDTVTQSSAHYFVSDSSIYQSVPDNYVAYAVGLGSMKEPYFKWPMMWKKITNSNSISIELCGGPGTTEPTELTKSTAAQLTVDLLEKYSLSPACVYRHYDVTGKSCPLWAVNDPEKWYDFKMRVQYYFNNEGDDDEMRDTPENYEQFKKFMDKYNKEQAMLPATWDSEVMQYCAAKKIIVDGRPKANITRGEVAQIVRNILSYLKIG